MRITPDPLTFASETLLSLLIAGILSCRGITDPAFPADAVPMQPPRVYAMWWQLTEACSGLRGDFASIRWYEVPNASQILLEGTALQGYWWSDENRIVLASSKILEGQLVRHEMLHALTRAGHSHEYFMDKCGGVVACEGDCLREAGDTPSPPADPLTIDPSDLSVETKMEPPGASISTDSGWVAITISARNTRNVPVWVRMTYVAPGDPASATFGYLLRCISGGCWSGDEYSFVWANKVGFAAGQTRRHVFDRRLEPGTYSLRGFFNLDTTSTTTFQISAQ